MLTIDRARFRVASSHVKPRSMVIFISWVMASYAQH